MLLLSQVMHQNGYRRSYQKYIKKNGRLQIVNWSEWVTVRLTYSRNVGVGLKIKGII